MKKDSYDGLAGKSLARGTISDGDILSVLKSPDADLPDLLAAVWKVRRRYFGNRVRVQILNNVQSGNCREDCRYCSQSAASGNKAAAFPMKEEKEIIAGADRAMRAGAYRYCMAFSGRFLSGTGKERVASVLRKIRKKHPRLGLCVSAGFLDDSGAMLLKESGADRYNHNLNTSEGFYRKICTTHGYEERIRTIRTARKAGLTVCSGVIIGLGETPAEIVKMCRELARVRAASVPVNFFIPVKGHRIRAPEALTPLQCLKTLCAFRLALPKAEIRAAAGREHHLRSLQPLCLYPANSLFAAGYLTSKGDGVEETMAMIRDAGFIPERGE